MPVSHTMTDATAEGPEPFELLRRLELLRSLDDTTLEAVMEGVEPVRLQEGQVLVRQGELDDALYAVASGTLRTVTVPPSGDEWDFKRYGPGGVLGEIQLVLGGAWTATIEAEFPCLLYRLPRAVLDALSDRKGEILQPLVWIVRSRMGRATGRGASALPRSARPTRARRVGATGAVGDGAARRGLVPPGRSRGRLVHCHERPAAGPAAGRARRPQEPG